MRRRVQGDGVSTAEQEKRLFSVSFRATIHEEAISTLRVIPEAFARAVLSQFVSLSSVLLDTPCVCIAVHNVVSTDGFAHSNASISSSPQTHLGAKLCDI